MWLCGRLYCFHLSRDIAGTIKTLTIKRLATGRIEIIFSCLVEEESRIRVKTGQTAGFDFLRPGGDASVHLHRLIRSMKEYRKKGGKQESSPEMSGCPYSDVLRSNLRCEALGTTIHALPAS